MNFRRFQGWALVINALIGLLVLISGDMPFFRLLFVIGPLLFIVGVPAIQSVQPMGRAGLVGIILLELAAVIALGVSLFFLKGGASVGNAIIFTSVMAGALGGVIVGSLTIRQKEFPAWAGWAFLLQGLLRPTGLFDIDLGTLGTVIGAIIILLGSAALFGYGFVIVRRQS